MDLAFHVQEVMDASTNALTVDEVSRGVADRLRAEIKAILNGFAKSGRVTTVHGGGGYQSVYKAAPLSRRF